MRLLFLSNLYPPAGNGGFEQWCQEAAEGLTARNHSVEVLTSGRKDQSRMVGDPSWVRRELHMEMEFASLVNGLEFFTRRREKLEHNLDSLRRRVSTFQPDAVMVWGIWNLPRQLPALAERLLPGKVVYYFGDYWPALPSQHLLYWQAPAQNWATRLPKRLLKPLAQQVLRQEKRPELAFAHALFPSRFMKTEYDRRGISTGKSRVITGGVDTHPFLDEPQAPAHHAQTGLSLLYAGRLSPEKGIETALEALERLAHQPRLPRPHLTIVGSGETGYVNSLRERVRRLGLEDRVSFTGPISKGDMPALYRKHDVFLFPSIWEEPFGRVLVEAMASGLVVVGTATGGAAEILQDGENALVFPPADSASLAARLNQLVEQPDLHRNLVETARQETVPQFDIERMVTEIEAYLLVELAALEDQPV